MTPDELKVFEREQETFKNLVRHVAELTIEVRTQAYEIRFLREHIGAAKL
jgi:hypothetical protein